MKWRVVISFVGLLALVACTFDYRAPSGSRNEDALLLEVPTALYRALARHDTILFARTLFPAATVLVDGGKSPVTLVPARALLELVERRTEPKGVRIVRTDIRTDGDLATVRAVIAADSKSDPGEYEASDFLTLARRDGVWRIAHVVLGPWRLRSAP